MALLRNTLRVIAWCVVLLFSSLQAQDKPAEMPESPQPQLAIPIAIVPGKAVTVAVRGQRMDTISEVKLDVYAGEMVPQISIKKKEKSNPPERTEAKDVGDSLAELEFTLPENFAEPKVALMFTNEKGTSGKLEIAVFPADKVLEEVESNGGFKTAQDWPAGKIISGSIQQKHDVDCFKVSGKAGQKCLFSVQAAARGSALDGQFTLYDSRKQIVAQADDQGPKNRDARLEVILPRDDTYFLVLQDATDRGGAHPYLLLWE